MRQTKVNLSLNIVFAFILLGCSATNKPEPPSVWYDGGTLHDSTYAEWQAGKQRDKLATAADWVTAFEGFGAPEEIRVKAERLLVCIDETAVDNPQTIKTHTVAQICHSP